MTTSLFAGDLSSLHRPENKPLVVILMGPPGAGKGTHAGPLSECLGVPHISTGDLFREQIRSETPLGQKAKSYIAQGHLVPDSLVLDMLFARVRRRDCKNGYLLDGFPRTIAQAKALDERLCSTHRTIVLNFSLSDEKVIERIAGRISCRDCGALYHKVYDPPKKGVCSRCGGSLCQREDDKEEIVRKRLDVYRIQTHPLIAYYCAQKGVLQEIDSESSKEKVFQDILEALPAKPFALSK